MRRTENYKIILTDHAEQRMIERGNYRRSSTYRMAEKAYKYGISQFQTTGDLNSYFSHLESNTKKQKKKKYERDMIIYNGKVFIFEDTQKQDDDGNTIIILITMWLLPSQYKDTAAALQKEYKAG